MYTVSSLVDTPHPDLANAAAPTPVTAGGTDYRVTPTDTTIAQTITFGLKVTATGGKVEIFDYTLVMTPPACSLVEDASFLTTHTFYLISGTTAQDLTFPVWTASGCTITKYEVDSDLIATPIETPVGVSIKSGCTQPCNTLTFTTTAVTSYTFYIYVTSSAASVYST